MLRRLRDYRFKAGCVIGIAGTQAQVHQIHALFDRPLDGRQQTLRVGAQRGMKQLHGQVLRVGGFFLNRGHHGGPMSQHVGIGAFFNPAPRTHRKASCHVRDMRMICVDAAIDDRNTQSPAGA